MRILRKDIQVLFEMFVFLLAVPAALFAGDYGLTSNLPDLVLTSSDMVMNHIDSETVEITISVHNKGYGDAKSVTVDIFDDDPKTEGN